MASASSFPRHLFEKAKSKLVFSAPLTIACRINVLGEAVEGTNGLAVVVDIIARSYKMYVEYIEDLCHLTETVERRECDGYQRVCRCAILRFSRRAQCKTSDSRSPVLVVFCRPALAKFSEKESALAERSLRIVA